MVTSFFCFSQLNSFLKCGAIAAPKKYDGKDQHKWRNTVGSLIHAAVVGILSTLSLPAVWSDFVEAYSKLGEFSLAIALGYLVYDMLDLIKNKPLNQIWPLLAHHCLAGTGAFICIWRQEYLGYGVFCSMAEVNSVNLHLRLLLLMYGVPKTSTVYRINNVINLITYIFLRMPIFALILVFLVNDQDRMLVRWNSAMFYGDVVLIVINLALLKRLIMNDFFGKPSNNNHVKAEDKTEDLMDL